MTRSKLRFFFKNVSTRQIILKNTFWVLSTEVASRLFKFILIPYSARVLGPEQFGMFYYYLSLAGLFYLLSDLGISTYFIREYQKNPTHSDTLTVTMLLLKWGLIFICFLMSLSSLISQLNSPHFFAYIVCLLILFTDYIKKSLNTLLNAQKKNEVYAIFNIFRNSLVTLIGILLLKLSGTLLFFFTAYLIAHLIDALLYIAYFKNKIPSFSKFNTALIKPIIRHSFPFMMTALIGSVLVMSDTLMIKWVLNAKQVAYYQSALRIYLVICILQISIINVIYPLLCQYNTVKERVASMIKSGISMTNLIYFPIAIGGILLSNNIIQTLYGDTYIQSIPVLIILMGCLLVNGTSSMINSALISCHFEIKNMSISAIAMVINIILNLMFIFKFGIIGIALATLISRSLDLVMSTPILYRHLKRPLIDFKSHLKIIISCIIMGLCIYQLLQNTHLHLIILISIGAAVYLLCLLVFKEKNLNKLITLVHKNILT